MIVFGQHASQKVPIQGRCSTRPVQRYRIVRRLPKVGRRRIENANGVRGHWCRFGEWMVGHAGIYPVAYETLFQMYQLHDSGRLGDVTGALDARNPPGRLWWADSQRACPSVRTHRLSDWAVVKRNEEPSDGASCSSSQPAERHRTNRPGGALTFAQADAARRAGTRDLLSHRDYADGHYSVGSRTAHFKRAPPGMR
jgi:hypothetical protein